MNKKSTFKKTLVTLVMFGLSFFSFGQVILNEGFESGTFPPTGWTTLDQNAEPIDDWDTLNLDNYSGGTFLAHSGSLAAASRSWIDVPYTPDNWLITPQLSITDASMSLKFFGLGTWGEPSNATGDFLEVYVSTTGTATTDFNSIFSQNFATQTWEEVSLSLAAFVGQNIYIAFRHYNCTDQELIALDDIIVATPFEDLAIAVTGELSEYTNTPLNQNPIFNINAEVSSIGTATSGAFDVNTNIYLDPDYTTPVQTYTFNGASLAVGSTAQINYTYTPTVTGTFVAVHEIVSATDINATNDLVFNYSTASDVTYARDLGFGQNGELISGQYGSNGTDGITLGQTFYLNSTQTMDSVLFIVSPNAVGGTISVVITGVSGGLPDTIVGILGQSALINITQAEVDETTANGGIVYVLPITTVGGNQLVLQPGNYFVGITQSAAASNMGLYYSTGIVTTGTSLGANATMTGGAFDLETDGGLAATPMITAFIGTPPTPPTIMTDTPTNTVCSPSTITLTSSYATGNQWNMDGQPINGQTGQTLIVNATGTYTVTTTVNGNPYNSTDMPVAVNALPVVNAGNDMTICSGASATLMASGASTYTWSNGMTNGATFMPSSTASYNVVGVDANGCVNMDDVMVTVNSNPVIAAGAIVNSTCGNSDATIEVTGSSTGDLMWTGASNGSLTGVTLPQTLNTLPAGAYTIMFSDAATCMSNTLNVSISDQTAVIPVVTASGPVTFCAGGSVDLMSDQANGITWSNFAGTNQAINVTSSGTYFVTMVNGNCVSTSDAIVVTVNSIPTTAILSSNNPTTCAGMDGSILVNTSSLGTISWSGAATGTMTITSSPVLLTGLGQGAYTISFMSNESCSATDISASLSDPNATIPTITTTGSLTICEGQTVTLNSSLGDTYLWSNGLTTPTIDVMVGGDYTVTTLLNGCSGTSLVTTVVANALPTVNAGADMTVCAGVSVTLSGAGATSYTWDPVVANGQAFIPSATTTYTVTGTDGNGCMNTDDVMITVNTPMISAGGDMPVCTGNSVTLTASGANSYSWTGGLTTPSITVSPASSTTYTVTGTDGNGCTGSDDVMVTVNALPTINAGSDVEVCSGLTVTLQASGGVIYTWDPIVTNGQAFTPTDTMTYTVTGTDVNGCVNTDAVTVNVLDCAGLDENSTVSLNVYPNPTTGIVTISADDFKGYTAISVKDQVGRNVVESTQITSNMMTVDLGSLANGTYLVVLTGASSSKVVQVQLNK